MGITATVGQQAASQSSAMVWLERILWVSWVPLVLYTVFFASIPDVHDGMHPVRHSTTIVQCH